MYNNYNTYQPYAAPQPAPALNGKIVDSIDVVRSMDVPMGSYGIYPKADFSEIYIKSWSNNGTTAIKTFKLQEELPVEDYSNEAIIKRLEKIEEYIKKEKMKNEF